MKFIELRTPHYIPGRKEPSIEVLAVNPDHVVAVRGFDVGQCFVLLHGESYWRPVQESPTAVVEMLRRS